MERSRHAEKRRPSSRRRAARPGRMQFQVDAGASRPTFFELVAADRLVPSLRAALAYSLGVLAARRPGLTRVLDFEDEAFAVFMLLVEAHSFAMGNGSMAEGLYGLQRSRMFPRRSIIGGDGDGADGAAGASQLTGAMGARSMGASMGALRTALGSMNLLADVTDATAAAAAAERRKLRISRSQRVLSVLTLVGVPYVRDKLEKLYARLSGAQLAVGSSVGGAQRVAGAGIADAIMGADFLGQAAGERDGVGEERQTPDRGGEAGAGAAAHDAQRATGPAGGSENVQSLRRLAETAFIRAYPYAHAAWEAVVFLHWLRYLLGGGDVHDPVLRALRVRVTRTSPAEVAENHAQINASRRASLRAAAAAEVPGIVRWLGLSALRARHFAIDYAQGGLMMAVVGFKLMEWWYGTAEERLQHSATLPVPPPPPRTAVHPDGVPVPPPGPDGNAPCPLCLRVCTEPALVRRATDACRSESTRRWPASRGARKKASS